MGNDNKPKKRGPKEGSKRRTLEERLIAKRAEVADLEMRAKAKDDPEKAKTLAEIRKANKRPQTPARDAWIRELKATL